jgi:ribosomal-protein-alanine N-acetyltransferase
MQITTDRLQLRQWQADDVDRYTELLSLPDVTRFMLPMPRVRIEALAADYLRQWDEQGLGPFAAVDLMSGAWIGQIGLSTLADWPDDDNVELGYELHPAWWGRGLATEGGRAALDFGFRSVGLTRIISTTNPANLPSVRVMQKLGLTPRGQRLYHGHQTVWYAIDRLDWRF